MYYFFIPTATGMQLIWFPKELALILLCTWLNLRVFSSIWIPSGDAIASREEGSTRIPSRSLVLVVSSCFYCGLAPIACWLLGVKFGRTAFFYLELAFLLTLLPPVLWHPVRRANGYKEHVESKDSPGYLWLPVVATSTLIPLQLAARTLIRKLDVPVSVIVAGLDNVVDNENIYDIFPRTECIFADALSHGDWTPANQDEMLKTLISLLDKG